MKKKRAHAGHRKKHAAQNHMCRKIRLGYLSADFGMGRARDLLPAFFSGYDQLRYEVYAYHTGIGGDVEPFSKEVEFREIGRNSAEEAAALIRRDAVDLLVARAQENERRRPLLADATAEFKAVGIGQADIQHDAVKALRLQGGERGDAGIVPHHLPLFARKGIAERVGDGGVVFDEQDVFHAVIIMSNVALS